MTKAAIYTRISQDRGGQAAGIARQREDCEALVQARGWTVAGLYEDNDVSAYSRRPRPAFERLMADIAAGEIDAVVAWTSDRLYRRTTDLARLIDDLGKVEVATVKSGDVDLSTADGRLRARILADVSEHESEKKGERVAAAAAQRAKAGRFGGGARRFGYTKTADALVPEEADRLRDAYLYVLNGGSLESLVRKWKAEQVRMPRGGEAAGTTIRDMLLRPMNAGIAVYKGEEVGRTTSPVIIDEETFRTVRAILTDPARRTTRGRPASTLLAGVMRCGRCGKRVAGASRVYGDRLDKIYACRSRCVTRKRDRFDEAMTALILQRLVQVSDQLKMPTKTAVAGPVVMEAEKLRARLEDLAALFANGDVDAADYAAATRSARDRLSELEAKVQASAGAPVAAKMIKADDIEKAWTDSDLATKRAIIKELITVVTIHQGKPGPFSMNNVDIEWKV